MRITAEENAAAMAFQLEPDRLSARLPSFRSKKQDGEDDDDVNVKR